MDGPRDPDRASCVQRLSWHSLDADTDTDIVVKVFSNSRKTQQSNFLNKKHLKNVGSIRHNEPPHANSPDVASGTVVRRLRIDVHDNDDNDNA